MFIGALTNPLEWIFLKSSAPVGTNASYSSGPHFRTILISVYSLSSSLLLMEKFMMLEQLQGSIDKANPFTRLGESRRRDLAKDR